MPGETSLNLRDFLSQRWLWREGRVRGAYNPAQ